MLSPDARHAPPATVVCALLSLKHSLPCPRGLPWPCRLTQVPGLYYPGPLCLSFTAPIRNCPHVFNVGLPAILWISLKTWSLSLLPLVNNCISFGPHLIVPSSGRPSLNACVPSLGQVPSWCLLGSCVLTLECACLSVTVYSVVWLSD